MLGKTLIRITSSTCMQMHITKGCSWKDLGDDLCKKKAGVLLHTQSQDFATTSLGLGPSEGALTTSRPQLPSETHQASPRLVSSPLPTTSYAFLLFRLLAAHRHISGNSTRSSALRSTPAKIHRAQRINWRQAGVSDCFPVATDTFLHWPVRALRSNRAEEEPAKAHFICNWNSTQEDRAVCRARGWGREFYKFLSMSGP